ncbi:MAG: DnaB helicase C-terminal domain-containing protein [Deltaproteobacteria bacterium]|nr:DnaB helicase C-terminal domain-containing protein [Deltaproteobacteria bacterium]
MISQRIETTKDREGLPAGLPTGFRQLDDLIGGMKPGDLIVLAGRPSMGKTALALQMVFNSVRGNGRLALLFSLETSKKYLVRRLLSTEGRIDSSKIREPRRLEEADWRRLMVMRRVLQNARVHMDDTKPLTTLDILHRSRELHAEGRCDLVCVDSLQMVYLPDQSASRGSAASHDRKCSEIARALKGLAVELSVPVVAVSQLKRPPETRADKRPLLGDLGREGAVGRFADVVLFLHRDALSKRHRPHRDIAEVIVAKQRNGPAGTVRLGYTREYPRFDDLHGES